MGGHRDSTDLMCIGLLHPDKNDTHRLSLDFYDQPALWSDQCTWPWGHCLLSELREWRQQTGRHDGLKEFGAPLTIGEAYLKIIMSSFLGFCEGDTRNRWRDGQVCPNVDKELWRLEPDGSGEEQKERTRESGRENGRKEEERRKRERGDGKRVGDRESEARLEWRKRVESGNWSEKDDERRWR
ncbi:hypothetical protein TNCV_3349201 [Trichonephila clavipes]|nr:hypothetical protein TNCV_3349201 [Trichonephila clavipes]